MTPALALLLVAAQETPDARFEVDPTTHLVLIGVSLGIAGGLEAVVRTNVLAPPAPASDGSDLNRLDRAVALDDNRLTVADPISDAIVYATMGFAVVDGILAATLADRESPWVYASVYAETAAFNWALANTVKIAVKRPRPFTYQQTEGGPSERTDDSLSFYSLHTSLTAGVAANATYLAFTETGSSLRSWLTLAVGALSTGLVGAMRVASWYHFPTDVIAGALIGSSLGVLVPFLHDRATIQVSAAIDAEGAVIGVGGTF